MDEQFTESPRISSRVSPFSVTRTGILLIVIGHMLACVGVLWLAPGGWPILSPEFVSYRALPATLAVWIVISLLPRQDSLRSILIDCLGYLWLSMCAFSIAMWSSSFARLACVFFAALIVMWIASRHRRSLLNWRTRSVMLTLCVGLATAPFHLLRSPAATTKPLGVALRESPPLVSVHSSVRIGELARLDPTQANVTFSIGRRFVQIEPVLTFSQRSPDRTWTIFAQRKARRPPERTYLGLASQSASVVARYRDHDEDKVVADSELEVSSIDAGAFSIDATSKLCQDVYSHLNTFTQITLAGHKRLRIGFSAIPDKRFDVTHAEYPLGAPARFAFLGADHRLHVVEAQNAEKGPFVELGSGEMSGELTMGFFDGDERLFEITMSDWAAQASTALSPAAGWGVAQNAIEFGLLSDDPKSPLSIFLTLAATSVGRGWSSVGHSAGVYRNHIIVRLADNKSE